MPRRFLTCFRTTHVRTCEAVSYTVGFSLILSRQTNPKEPMKIKLQECAELSFEPAALERAEKALVVATDGLCDEDKDDLLDAMATLLLFRSIEKKAPGTINRVANICRK